MPPSKILYVDNGARGGENYWKNGYKIGQFVVIPQTEREFVDYIDARLRNLTAGNVELIDNQLDFIIEKFWLDRIKRF